MEQIRRIRHARWLSSLDMVQLCHYAEQNGVLAGIGEDRERLIERLTAIAVVQEGQNGLEVIEATPVQVSDEVFSGAQAEVEVQELHFDRHGVEDGPSAQALTEALELLAPLQNSRLIRGDSQMGNMLGSVLQQLQVQEPQLEVVEATPVQVSDEVFSGAQAEAEVQELRFNRRGVEHGPSAQDMTEALELLAPLRSSRLIRGDNEMGDMLGSVLQRLQAGVSASSLQSSAIPSGHDELIAQQGEHGQFSSASYIGDVGLAQAATAAQASSTVTPSPMHPAEHIPYGVQASPSANETVYEHGDARAPSHVQRSLGRFRQALAQSHYAHQGEHELLGSASVGGSSGSDLSNGGDVGLAQAAPAARGSSAVNPAVRNARLATDARAPSHVQRSMSRFRHALAQSYNSQQGERELLGSASVGGSSGSSGSSGSDLQADVPGHSQPPMHEDEPLPDAADAPSNANETQEEHTDAQTPSQVQRSLDRARQYRHHHDMFAEYRARNDERRAQTRRRRMERLAELNIALDQHFNAFAAGDFGAVDVPPAGDADFVERHSVTSVWAGADDTQCVICVEDIAQGDAVRTLACGHVYHQECVDMWLQRSRLCCLCKRPIDAPRQSNL